MSRQVYILILILTGLCLILHLVSDAKESYGRYDSTIVGKTLMESASNISTVVQTPTQIVQVPAGFIQNVENVGPSIPCEQELAKAKEDLQKCFQSLPSEARPLCRACFDRPEICGVFPVNVPNRKKCEMRMKSKCETECSI